MNRRHLAPALLLAAGLALAGCAGGKNETKPAKTEAAETTQAAERDHDADLDAAVDRAEEKGYTCTEPGGDELNLRSICSGKDAGLVQIFAVDDLADDADLRASKMMNAAEDEGRDMTFRTHVDDDAGVYYMWQMKDDTRKPNDMWQ